MNYWGFRGRYIQEIMSHLSKQTAYFTGLCT